MEQQIGTLNSDLVFVHVQEPGHPQLGLLSMPDEVTLHIMSYLDLPDLDNLSVVSPVLFQLTSDPILHQNRLRIITPCRIEHSLFAQGCHGTLLRPTVPDLVHMNIMRGLGIERHWRTGNYFLSAQSVKLYESSLRLEQARIIRILSNHLSARAKLDNVQLIQLRRMGYSSPALVALPSETVSPLISRRLIPIIARLKWSMKRDKLARRVRVGLPTSNSRGMINDERHLKSWLSEGSGRALLKESERVRLAICPGVNQFVKFFENLAVSAS